MGLLPALVWGVLVAFWRPRGPVFPIEAVAILLGSIAVGAFAGRYTRSRWAILLTPLLFLVAAEVTRVGFAGPTVDYPRPTALGILALIVGRGFQALLTLLPMGVAAAYGAGSTRHSRSPWRWVGRFVTGVLAVVVVATGVVVAVPGRAAPIDGAFPSLRTRGSSVS
ncbi:hypothetical protein ACFQS1_23140 [Paractinoplanes rhizophilus]|uniref:Uncharacterized protein n=1 Tax=Paractinoplanes rhizophilus TaxID=1416877 RepID=A0ABW2HUS5_9ACTN